MFEYTLNLIEEGFGPQEALDITTDYFGLDSQGTNRIYNQLIDAGIEEF